MTLMEYSIPVVFTVRADSRAEAADGLARALDIRSRTLAERVALDQPTLAALFAEHASAVLEEWWLPEAQDKGADGNDREALHLVPETTPEATLPRPAPVDLPALLAWDASARATVERLAAAARVSGDYACHDEVSAELAEGAWERLTALLSACADAALATDCPGCNAEPGEACRWGCLSRTD